MRHLVLLIAVLLMPAAAWAEAKPPLPPASITAIIDVQRILQESLAAKSVQKQLENQRAKFQAEISEQEKQLRDADEELKEARNTLAADAFAEREQKLRQKFTEVEREVQGKRHALDGGFTAAMEVVRKNLLDVVQDVAKLRGFNLVLLKQQSLWYDPALDITDDVLNRLNIKLTEVPVKVQFEDANDPAAAKNSKN
ncbi:MAG: OmpH family outer membrane protein [Alphaproteobacteria bacterium]